MIKFKLLKSKKVVIDNLSHTVDSIMADYFSAHGDLLPPSGVYNRVMREVEKPLIERSLKATNGNQIKTAALLGINRNTLRKKIRELGIRLEK